MIKELSHWKHVTHLHSLKDLIDKTPPTFPEDINVVLLIHVKYAHFLRKTMLYFEFLMLLLCVIYSVTPLSLGVLSFISSPKPCLIQNNFVCHYCASMSSFLLLLFFGAGGMIDVCMS